MSISVSESVSQEREELEEGESIQIQVQPGIPQIPFDLFVKKTRSRVRFTDAFGNLVYVGARRSSPHCARALFDSFGSRLISISRSHDDGSWKAFKGDGCSEHLLFRVEQTLNTFSKIEFNVFLFREDGEDIALSMRGCLYWRSCTIYQDKSIVAQTNLIYKLGFKKISKIFVQRSKFRVTFFPGFSDYNLIAALVLIFLDGR